MISSQQGISGAWRLTGTRKLLAVVETFLWLLVLFWQISSVYIHTGRHSYDRYLHWLHCWYCSSLHIALGGWYLSERNLHCTIDILLALHSAHTVYVCCRYLQYSTSDIILTDIWPPYLHTPQQITVPTCDTSPLCWPLCHGCLNIIPDRTVGRRQNGPYHHRDIFIKTVDSLPKDWILNWVDIILCCVLFNAIHTGLGRGLSTLNNVRGFFEQILNKLFSESLAKR